MFCNTGRRPKITEINTYIHAPVIVPDVSAGLYGQALQPQYISNKTAFTGKKASVQMCCHLHSSIFPITCACTESTDITYLDDFEQCESMICGLSPDHHAGHLQNVVSASHPGLTCGTHVSNLLFKLKGDKI